MVVHNDQSAPSVAMSNHDLRLSDDDVQRIAVALRSEMVAFTHATYVLTDEERKKHEQDHEFIDLIRRKVAAEESALKMKRERWTKIQDFITGSLILTVIIGTITLIGMGARLWLLDGHDGVQNKPDQHQQDQRPR